MSDDPYQFGTTSIKGCAHYFRTLHNSGKKEHGLTFARLLKVFTEGAAALEYAEDGKATQYARADKAERDVTALLHRVKRLEEHVEWQQKVMARMHAHLAELGADPLSLTALGAAIRLPPEP